MRTINVSLTYLHMRMRAEKPEDMGPSSFSMSVWTVAVLLAAVGVATVRLINKVQPEPYMVNLSAANTYISAYFTTWVSIFRSRTRFSTFLKLRTTVLVTTVTGIL